MRTDAQREARCRYNATPHGRAVKKAAAARYYQRHREERIAAAERYQATTAGLLSVARRELRLAQQRLENL